MKHGGLV